MFSARSFAIRATLLSGVFSAAVAGAGAASADDAERTTQNAISSPDTGAPPVIPRPMAPGTYPVKPKPVLTVPAVKPIPRPVPRPRPVSVIPPGTGGIKPPRPVVPPELLGPPLVNPAYPAGQPVATLPWVPKPKPRPAVNTDPPAVDPNIVGYAEDGSPIYPWGPRPQPPKPIKTPPLVAEIDPNQTPPIVRPENLPGSAPVALR